MSELKEHLQELDELFEKMEDIVREMDEQNHFDNEADIFFAVSEIGIAIDAAKKIIYQNLGD